MRSRVVVTGLGWVTPLGIGKDAVWRRLIDGQSGVGPITRFDPVGLPAQIAAEVPAWEDEPPVGDVDRWAAYGRHSQFAVTAATEAMQHAGLESHALDVNRFGVYLGAGEGEMQVARVAEMFFRGVDGPQFHLDRALQAAATAVQVEPLPDYDPAAPAGHVATALGAAGPNYSCLTACAAGAQAIAEAADLIRDGQCDLVLAGGTHSIIHPWSLLGFCLLGALSTNNDEPTAACRPFDRDRDGFVIAEGAAMLVIESAEHAARRNAPVLAEVSGYACTSDAYRTTDSHPDGRGAQSALVDALRAAQLTPKQIDYICAHGTGTQINDRVETSVIKKVLGDRAYDVPVSSVKGALGHAIAAAGAIGAVASILALEHQVVPPTLNYTTPTPECDLDYVPRTARTHTIRHAVVNSYGFGGQNVSLVLSRPTD